MKIALFVPCYVQATFPEVGAASLRLLRALGVDVEVPQGQTCCFPKESCWKGVFTQWPHRDTIMTA